MDILHNDIPSGLSFRLRPAAGQAAARLFLLHGVGGNETNLMPLAQALDPRLELVFVRGPLTLGPGQHAWFHVRFTAQGPVINAGQADESRTRLRELVRSLARADAPVARPAMMAGFSQGGILSASVALSAPEDVPRFAILSGRILPEIEPHLAPPDRLAQVSAFIAHGQHDDKLPVSFARHADNWLTRLGVVHDTHLYPVGHTLSADIASDFTRWIHQQINLD
ncbi:alpha/beta hydrolase [Paraburkholderia sacchari]|uniref:alpha/beta hydrolase n=1 Tax=Paraburkholderia sacchari TaxID=159450 RepID=UPI0005420AEB|nr:phospholipase [Paraburkholderia sacchari]NLP65050.1 phospholipase [Paraburkholderia sacchari]